MSCCYYFSARASLLAFALDESVCSGSTLSGVRGPSSSAARARTPPTRTLSSSIAPAWTRPPFSPTYNRPRRARSPQDPRHAYKIATTRCRRAETNFIVNDAAYGNLLLTVGLPSRHRFLYTKIGQCPLLCHHPRELWYGLTSSYRHRTD